MRRIKNIILFIILLSSFVGCKKDDVIVQEFNIISDSVVKNTKTITLIITYSYPSVLKTVEGYISDNYNMDGVINAHGIINDKSFILKFEGLKANTNYYYYYEYSNGIDDIKKSDIKTIVTNDYSLPKVTTGNVTSITAISAMCEGKVIDDGEAEITARGICYGINENPTIYGSHTTIGVGTGAFISRLADLDNNTTYYVRAYATNSKGTSYGEQKTFNTLWLPVGNLDGKFSINGSQCVYFSKGNLQYKASTNIWRFADNQYDYIGNNNSNISPTYDGWIDLFAWGTSGYNHGAICYQPYSTSDNCDDYYAYGSYLNNLYSNDGRADWGYNAISNGGDIEHKWHTLTKDEWMYVFNTRSTASNIRYAKAKINGVNGVLLLPDDWNSSIYNLTNTNNPDSEYTSNIISLYNFKEVLEANGVVFLPAAGYREGTSINYINESIVYWSASTYYNITYWEYYNAYGVGCGDYYKGFRRDGQSVRLVCDVE